MDIEYNNEARRIVIIHLFSSFKISRTKVECGGQCLSADDCEAFEFLKNEDETHSCR